MTDRAAAPATIVPPDAEAAVRQVRVLLGHSRQSARGFAHRLLDEPATATIGALCSAIVAHEEGFCDLAYALLDRLPAKMVRCFAAVEWLSAGLETGKPEAVQALRGSVDWVYAVSADALSKLVRRAFERGLVDDAHRLCRAFAERKDRLNDAGAQPIAAWLDYFDEAAIRAQRKRAEPPTQLALFDWAQPCLPSHEDDTQWAVLIRMAEQWVGVEPGRWSLLDPSTERARFAALAGPLFVVGGRLERNSMWRLAAAQLCRDVLVLSLQVPDMSGLAPPMLDMLRRWAPIGCRDWGSVMRLREHAVPAFFAAPLDIGVDPLTWSARRNGQRRAIGDDRLRIRLEQTSRYVADRRTSAQGVDGQTRKPHQSNGDSVLDREGLHDLHSADLVALHDRCQQRLLPVLRALLLGPRPGAIWEMWSRACSDDLSRVEPYLTVKLTSPAPVAAIGGMLGRIRTYQRVVSRHDQDHDSLSLCASVWSTGAPTTADVAGGNGDVVQLAMAADRQMLDPLNVLLESIVESHAGRLHVHLLTRGLAADDWLRIAEGFNQLQSRLTMSFHDFSGVGYGDDMRILAHTTVSTIDRLLLPELLRHLPKIIYLDTDLIVLSDLSDLWNVDFRGMRLAAKSSSSPGARTVDQMIDRALRQLSADAAVHMRHRLVELGPTHVRAFNAGVLVLNLERMRAERFSERFVPLVGTAAMNDQDVLNIYARDQRVELDRRWNAIPRQDLTDGAWIVHFAGPVKPWSKLYISRAGDFHAYATRYRERVASLGRE